MSNELFYAILAMDAYNRGYDAKLTGLSDAVGTKLGNATVIGSAGGAAAQADGFYAIAYDLNGQKIISYRGTDNPNIFSKGNDIWNGWVQGAGFVSSQSEDAIKFYEQISGQSVFKANPGVITTGHSLGGGLAGYVGALSNGQAYVYDAMPFGAASITRVIREQMDQANWLTGPAELTAFLTTKLSRFVQMPDADHVNYISVDGEVLQGVRTAALTLGSALEVAVATTLIGSNLAYAGVAIPTGLLAGPWALSVSLEGSEIKLNPLVTSLGAVDLHSQGLLALLQYAKDNNDTAWHKIADSLLSGWFQKDSQIAKSLGLNDNDQMLREIVYTALDSGETPYGTVAIKALFDDANQLGTLYAQTDILQSLNQASVKSALTSMVSGYAGYLATQKSTDANLAQGIVELDTANHQVIINLTPTDIADTLILKGDMINGLAQGFKLPYEVRYVDYVLAEYAETNMPIVAPAWLSATDGALIIGSGTRNDMTGSIGDDFFVCADNCVDHVNGLSGSDTVVYSGNKAEYIIARTENGFTVKTLESPNNFVDTLNNVETIKFADGSLIFGVAQTQTNTEIYGLYDTILNRAPTEDEFDFWVGAVESGQLALGQVANSLLGSDEYLEQTTDAATALQLYANAFELTPDVSALNYWTNKLQSGYSVEQIALEFGRMNQPVVTTGIADGGYWVV
jgi:hypothetical protein